MSTAGEWPASRRRYLRSGATAFLVLALLLTMTVNLDSTPAVWWDEGWTLLVARNWVERGFYGRLLDGQPFPPGLEAAFPTTALVALSFRLLGIGVWQGRLAVGLTMIGAAGILCYLAGRLYNRAVVAGTLVVLLLTPRHWEIHPLLIGRQVLAEGPMVLFVLAGYACFLAAQRRPARFMPAAVFLWGVALVTKAQVLPFWVASLLVPLAAALWRRRWRAAALTGAGILASLTLYWLLPRLQQAILRGHTMPPVTVGGLYEVNALVLDPWIHLHTIRATLLTTLPLLFGLGHAFRRCFRGPQGDDLDILRLSLLSLVGSWLAWYLFFSAGWARYVFPATFIGSLFISVWLHDLTGGYRLRAGLDGIAQALRRRRLDRKSAAMCLVLLLAAVYLPLSIVELAGPAIPSSRSVFEVASFFNTETPPGTRVETYDAELLFLLDRPYHYPPDQVHVESIRRSFRRQDVPVDYDPLAADPDYLVVGPFGRGWGIYDKAVKESFRLLRKYDLYEVYERVR